MCSHSRGWCGPSSLDRAVGLQYLLYPPPPPGGGEGVAPSLSGAQLAFPKLLWPWSSLWPTAWLCSPGGPGPTSSHCQR